MLRSLVRFQTVDTGPHTLVASMILPAPQYAVPATRIAFLERLLERLQSTPGLVSVTASAEVPTSFSWTEIHTERAQLPEVATAVVMPGYFKTIGATILRGRDFDSGDGSVERPV